MSEHNADPFEQRVERLFAPGAVAKVMARLRSRALDRALMDGADPSGSSQLAARAAVLTRRATRTRLAAGLERLLGAADHAPRRWSVPPARGAVRSNTAELAELAALLRGAGPLYAPGVAMVRELLTDGTGSAYTDPSGATLAVRLCRAREALGAWRGLETRPSSSS